MLHSVWSSEIINVNRKKTILIHLLKQINDLNTVYHISIPITKPTTHIDKTICNNAQNPSEFKNTRYLSKMTRTVKYL